MGGAPYCQARVSVDSNKKLEVLKHMTKPRSNVCLCLWYPTPWKLFRWWCHNVRCRFSFLSKWTIVTGYCIDFQTLTFRGFKKSWERSLQTITLIRGGYWKSSKSGSEIEAEFIPRSGGRVDGVGRLVEILAVNRDFWSTYLYFGSEICDFPCGYLISILEKSGRSFISKRK